MNHELNNEGPRSIGIDLAGYSSGRSSIAVLQQLEDGVAVDWLKNSPFQKKYSGSDRLANVLQEEREFLTDLMKRHSVLVLDAPLDLTWFQTDRKLDPANRLWALQYRPFDYLFGAMPPLASRLGALAARADGLIQSAGLELGETVFESYPAGSLALLIEKIAIPYKGCVAEFRKGTWTAPGAPPKSQEGIGLPWLLNHLTEHFGLSWDFPDRFHLSDDDLDALICGLVGLRSSRGAVVDDHRDAIERSAYYAKLSANCGMVEDKMRWPKGTRILVDWPERARKIRFLGKSRLR